MAYRHDFVFLCPCGDLEVGGEGAGTDDEGMVACGVEGVGQADEEAFVVVVDGRDFAVHEPPVAFDGCAPDVTDALVAEAYAQGREPGPEVFEDVAGNAGFFGGAGAGGNDDVRGTQRFDFGDRRLVVAEDGHRA